MSITRVQQARQMYALGKLVERVGGIMGSNGGSMLVTPTRDGSRPGYSDTGPGGNPGDVGAGHTGDSIGGGNGGDYNYRGPADLGVTTRTVNKVTAPNAKEYIGGKAFDVTPDTKDERERAKVKQSILNPTVKRNKIFDPISNSFINPLASTQKKGFGLLDLALFALGPLGVLGQKGKTIASAISLGKRAKKGLDTVTSIADQFDIENPIGNLFSGNNKSTSKSKSTSKNNTTTNNNGGGDGEGIATLENQASGYDEYILLLQKLQSGNISDSERNRYNVLKNKLGI